MTKAQAWYMDFAIALLLFTFTLIVYFGYTTNFQKEEQSDLGELLDDARAISSSLTLNGYPTGWNITDVARIGLADEQRLNTTKLKSFKELNYTGTKSKLSTIYDYFVFFVNDKNEVMNINGICGAGNKLVNVTYNTKSAYYYSDEDESFLLDFMKTNFNADIYSEDDEDDYDLESFITNISKYQFIMLEHPDISPSDFDEFRTAYENYTSLGGLSMISGQLTPANNRGVAGVDFRKKSGESTSDREAIVNNTDQYLELSIGQFITFKQAYYVENQSEAANFTQIATFVKDGRNALSEWQYGNGTIYFFSDFDVSYFAGNFTNVIKEGVQAFIGGTCTPINLTGLNQKKLVKAERYLAYKSNVIKMIVYVWE